MIPLIGTCAILACVLLHRPPAAILTLSLRPRPSVVHRTDTCSRHALFYGRDGQAGRHPGCLGRRLGNPGEQGGLPNSRGIEIAAAADKGRAPGAACRGQPETLGVSVCSPSGASISIRSLTVLWAMTDCTSGGRTMDAIHLPPLPFAAMLHSETPDTFHFLQANNNVPLATTFKPQVKVLSRRPVIAKRDPATGMSQLSLDDDPAEGAKRDNQPTPEEIRARQKQEREEKQRRYDEARAKIFGEPLPSSGASSPGTVTPPRSDGQRTPRGRGRGRGGSNIPRNNERNNGESSQSGSNRRNNMQPGPGRELYDPNYSPKPDSPAQGRGSDNRPQVRSSAPKSEQPAIRAPRGPTTSGRGGFGFAKRGGKET